MRNLCKDYLRAFGSSRIGAIHTIQYVLSTGDDELPSVNSFNREPVFYTFTQTSQQDSTILLFGKILYFFSSSSSFRCNIKRERKKIGWL